MSYQNFPIIMAIQKKLLHFNDKSNFEIQLERGNILDTSIVFIKNTKQIWTHGQYYDSVTDELLNSLDNISINLRDLYQNYGEDGYIVEQSIIDQIVEAYNNNKIIILRTEGLAHERFIVSYLEVQSSQISIVYYNEYNRNTIEINRSNNISTLTLTNIPTLTSQLTNDSGFITNSALDSYYTKTETLEQVNNKIQEVVGAAPEALDTLEEIAAKLNEDSDAIDAINGVLTGKATKEEVDSKVSKTGDETIDGNKTFTNNIKVGTNKVWHEGNDGPGSGLDADTLDGLQATDFIIDRTIGSKLDFEDLVILLWKESELIYHLLKGSLYTFRSGIGRHQTADVDIWFCRWGTGETQCELNTLFNTAGYGKMELVTCTYNGEKWYAIKHNLVQACNFKFAGIAIAVDFTVIKYYNRNTSTILNEEIYNSIQNVKFDQYITNKILPIPTSANNGNILQVINGKYQLSDISLEDQLSYGVEWDITVADPHLTRIGNMDFHRTLPIQSGMKGCVCQGKQIMYWLNENDWRFRKDSKEITAYTSGGDNIFNQEEYLFEGQVPNKYTYVDIDGHIGKVTSVGSTGSIDIQILQIAVEFEDGYVFSQEGSYTMRVGSNLSGYDGTVKVFVPKFYLKSEEDGNKCRVRISSIQIDNTWEESPAMLVDAYRDTILNAVPTNMGYLSTLPVGTAISVVNDNDYCRGGYNNASYDQYKTSDPFRCMLNKPRTNINRAAMRTAATKLNDGAHLMSYIEYKNLVWLLVIEYANLNLQEAFNSNLTSQGFRQGGLGASIANFRWDYWTYYSGNYPITPCGYLNEFGNMSGTKAITFKHPTTSGGEATQSLTTQAHRWRGIDNFFGDVWTSLDGVIIDAYSHPNDMDYVYIWDDPSKFSEIFTNDYIRKCESIHTNEYVKTIGLGDKGDLFAKTIGANSTTYFSDYHYAGESNYSLRSLLVGGSANNGYDSGPFCFNSELSLSISRSYASFRVIINI